MNKIEEIFKSWIIAANPSEAQKEVAQHRIEICNECPHRNHIKHLNAYTCGLCGCPLTKKIYSPAGPEACPDKRWQK